MRGGLAPCVSWPLLLTRALLLRILPSARSLGSAASARARALLPAESNRTTDDVHHPGYLQNRARAAAAAAAAVRSPLDQVACTYAAHSLYSSCLSYSSNPCLPRQPLVLLSTTDRPPSVVTLPLSVHQAVRPDGRGSGGGDLLLVWRRSSHAQRDNAHASNDRLRDPPPVPLAAFQWHARLP